MLSDGAKLLKNGIKSESQCQETFKEKSGVDPYNSCENN